MKKGLDSELVKRCDEFAIYHEIVQQLFFAFSFRFIYLWIVI